MQFYSKLNVLSENDVRQCQIYKFNFFLNFDDSVHLMSCSNFSIYTLDSRISFYSSMNSVILILSYPNLIIVQAHLNIIVNQQCPMSSISYQRRKLNITLITNSKILFYFINIRCINIVLQCAYNLFFLSWLEKYY